MNDRNVRERIRGMGLAGVILCLLAAALAGCTVAPTPAEPVTITFAHYSLATDQEHCEALSRAFTERYPHITVEVRPAAEAMEGGDVTTITADVFLALNTPVSALQEGGHVLSLDAYVEQDVSFDLSDFYPEAFEGVTLDGERWAVPAAVDPMVMVYNRDLFDQYGVSYPEAGWTWDDFLVRAQALSDPEAELLGDSLPIFGYGTRWYGWEAFVYVYQHGGGIVDDLYTPTRTTFDDPLTIEALEWYAELFHEYHVTPTLEQAAVIYGLSGDPLLPVYDAIAAGRIAMWMDRFTVRDGWDFTGDWFFERGMVPLPHDARPFTFLLTEAYFISSQTLHPDECWQWISFLSHEMPPHAVPPRRSLVESEEFEQLVGGDDALVARTSLEEGTWYLYGDEFFIEAYGAFNAAVEEIVEEGTPPQEAMGHLQLEMEE